MDRRSDGLQKGLQKGLQTSQQRDFTFDSIVAAREHKHSSEQVLAKMRELRREDGDTRESNKLRRIPEVTDRIVKHLDPVFRGSEILRLTDETYQINNEELNKVRKSQDPELKNVADTLRSQRTVLAGLRETTGIIEGNFQAFQATARKNFVLLDKWVGEKYKDDSQTQMYDKEVARGGNFRLGAPGKSADVMLSVDLTNLTSIPLKEYTFVNDSTMLRPSEPFGKYMPKKSTGETSSSQTVLDQSALQSNLESTRISDDHAPSLLHRTESVESIRSIDSVQESLSSHFKDNAEEKLRNKVQELEDKLTTLRSQKPVHQPFYKSSLYKRTLRDAEAKQFGRELDYYSKILDDPIKRFQRVKDFPEMGLSQDEKLAVEENAQARLVQKALQNLGKRLISQVYRETWDDPHNKPHVNRIEKTHNELLEYVQEMRLYAEQVRKDVKTAGKAPDIADVQTAINDYNNARQEFTRFVINKLNAEQDSANVYVGTVERGKTFDLVQKGYEANRSLGNLFQEEFKTLLNDLLSKGVASIP